MKQIEKRNSDITIFQETQRNNQQESIEEQILSILDYPDQEFSFCEMQKLISTAAKDNSEKKKSQLSFLEELVYDHECEKINEIDRQIDNQLQDLSDIVIKESQQFKEYVNQIKDIRKIITCVVDRYFNNIKEQIQNIEKTLYLSTQENFRNKLLLLKKQLYLQNEETCLLIELEFNQIKNEIETFKQSLPNQLQLQVKDQSLYIIKSELQQLLSISFKQKYNIIPEISNGLQSKKKKQVILKKPTNKAAQKLDQAEEIFAYVYHKKSFLYANKDNVNQYTEIQWQNTTQELPLQCNLVYHKKLNKIFMIGEQYGQSYSQLNPSDLMHCFNINTRTFEELEKMPIIGCQGITVLYNDYIYYWGGIVLSEDIKLNSKRGFKYNINSHYCQNQKQQQIQQQWERVASMKQPRINGTGCCIDNKIYLIGGMQNRFIGNQLIEIYCINEDKFIDSFSLLNSSNYQTISNPYLFILNQQEILIIGGWNTLNVDESVVQLLNLNTKTVQRGQQKITEIANTSSTDLLVINKKIYLFNQKKDKVEFIELNMDSQSLKQNMLLE